MGMRIILVCSSTGTLDTQDSVKCCEGDIDVLLVTLTSWPEHITFGLLGLETAHAVVMVVSVLIWNAKGPVEIFQGRTNVSTSRQATLSVPL